MAQQGNPVNSPVVVGEVQSVTGQAVAISASGAQRALAAGDPLYADDVVRTIGASTLVAQMNDGTRFDLGREGTAVLDEEVYGDDLAGIRADAMAEIVEIQAAIAAGADPTEITEAPAAGGDTTTEDSIANAVTVDRTGRVGEVEAGFETTTFGQAFEDAFESTDGGGDDATLLGDAVDGADDGGGDGGGAPTASIAITAIAGDDVVDAAEAGGTVAVTGTVGGDVADGDTVTLSVNGVEYSDAVVGGAFSIPVDGADLVEDPDSIVQATVTVTDATGNTASAIALGEYAVDTMADATVTLDPVTPDGVVNASEAEGTITVTGTVGGDASPGDTVVVTVNGTDYSGVVQSDNSFAIDVEGSDLVVDTSVDATVTGSDAAGNGFTATTTSSHTVDTTASATIAVDPITPDDLVSAAEAGGDVAVTGTVGGDAGPGDTVSFVVNGTEYSGTVNPDGTTWRVDVAGADLAADTAFDATVVGADAAGNPYSATTTSTHGVDTVADATITVDPITPDDVVNADEAGGVITVTGTVGGDASAGDTVSFTVNGTPYSGTVQPGNTFMIDVAGSDLAADTAFDATVSGSDDAGNPYSATTTSTHTVDATVDATITVDPITPDDVVSAAEAGGPIRVTGSVGGDASPGDSVTFTVNGTPYSGVVLSNNTFAIDVAGADLAADTTFDATVTGADAAGNPYSATTTSTHTVDTSAEATITVDPITPDDIVNMAEAGDIITVTGTVGGDATPGDTVGFTVNGTDYSGVVQPDNSFAIDVAGSDLAADTSFDATVSGSDDAGNPYSATTTSTHDVDTVAAATITVDPITPDDVVSAAEAGGTISVTGTVGGDASAGDTIRFTVNGTDYSGVVQPGNTFAVDVAGSDLAADAAFDATVDGTDEVGNPFSATTTSTHEVDTTAAATITVDAITSDDVINAAEAGADVTVTGTVGGDAMPGDPVTFSVNGTDYTGAVNPDGLTWQATVAGADLAADTDFDATVSGTDTAGNPYSATASSTHAVDTSAEANITVDPVTSDDVVNIAEAGGDVTLRGTVGGDAAPGDTVSFTVNGTEYSGVVQPGNTFAIDVAGSDLALDTEFDVTVTGTDDAGNSFSATTTSTHVVDVATSATISVDPITDDDVVNAGEAGGTIAVTGSVGGDASPGDTVSFTVNGTDYSGVVRPDGTFSIDVAGADLAADTLFDAMVEGTDDVGNPFVATTTSTHTVDTAASATITVDDITPDDVVNAAEAGGSIVVRGSVGGDAGPGDNVSFTVNGTDYSGVVQPGNTFAISVAGSDLAADTLFDATVSGIDPAGNPYSATTTSIHEVDTAASATITVDPVTSDDVINAAEAGGTVTVSGTIGGDAAPGDPVTLTVNGNSYSGTVNPDGLTWRIDVAGSDLAADTDIEATVSGSDDAGNDFTATTMSTHGVDTTAEASITVDDITIDDVVNAAEVGGTVTVTGSVGGDAAPGDSVSFTLNGTDYAGVVQPGNTFAIDVAGSDLAADTTFDATVTGTDDAGNSFTATTTSTHAVDTTAGATITVDAITPDNMLNAAEAGQTITVRGSVGGDAAPGDSVSLTINGTAYSGVVEPGNTFAIDVSGSDLAADTSFDATVSGSDDAGNPFSATTTSTHTVDVTTSATIAVDAITADDVINATEAGQTIAVTGSVGGDAESGDSVSFTLNGTDYSGIVQPGNTFSIDVAGADLAVDTTFDATVAGTDNAGNPFSATTTSTHVVDTTASATIVVDAITPDDVINASEAGDTITVTGSVGGDAAPGDSVSFTVNGTDYSGVVAPDNTFAIAVAGTDLAADTAFDASVSGNDDAGNPFVATTTSTHTVDTSATATISVDAITPDDVVNAAEAGGTVTVTGSVGGDAAPGDSVTFTLNGTDYDGVVQPGNTFAIAVAGADLAADTDFDATVTGTDAAGNPFTATTTSTHAVDTAASATITVDDITADDLVTAAEAGSIITVTGTVGGDAAPGDSVSFTVNGTDYSGTVQPGNTFSIDVAGSDLAADTDFDATVAGSDDAGNPFSATTTSTHTVNVLPPVAVADDLQTTEDTPLTFDVSALLGNDVDPEGATLSIVGATDGTGGTILLNGDGTATFTPAPDFNGQATFTYTVTDGLLTSAPATVTVDVTPVNDAPSVDSTSLTVDEGSSDTPLGLSAPTDADGDGLTIMVTGLPGLGSVTLADGTPVNNGDTLTAAQLEGLQYDAPDDYNGTDPVGDFSYSVDDGTTTTDGGVTLGVTPVNDAPSVDSTSLTVDEGSADTPLGLSAPTDADGDDLTITVTGLPDLGSVTLADGTPVNNGDTLTAAQLEGLQYDAPDDYNGTDPVGDFSYSVDDGTVTTDGGVSLGITPVNDAPVSSDGGATTDEDTVLVGSVPTATDVDGTISSYVLETDVTAGTLTFSPDGSFSFDPGGAFDDLAPGESRDVTFTYTALDDQGAASAPSTMTLTVTGVNDAPQIGTSGVVVSEEGLVGGLEDDVPPTLDQTDSRSASDNIALTDPDGDAIVSVALEAPATPLTSGGESLVWSGQGSDTLTATAGGETIATLTVDTAGEYRFDLFHPLDHAGDAGQEGVLRLEFGVTASDGIASTTLPAAITVDVEDDSPAELAARSDTLATLDSNLLITLDLSGSMAATDGLDGASRLDSAIQSINRLMDRYDALGDVMVRLVTFSFGAQARGDDWMTIDEVRSVLDTLSAGGGTNYDAAIDTAQAAFSDGGAIDGAQNVAYFLSDGEPLAPYNSIGIDSVEESAWRDFLATNQVKSFALAIGNGIDDSGPLDPIAYDGQGDRDIDALLVNDFADLDNALAGTLATSATGYLHSDGNIGAGSLLGADGGRILSLTSEGTTYSYDADNQSLSVSGTDRSEFDPSTGVLTITTTAGGVLVVDLDDALYTYSAPAGGAGTTVDYVVTDNDGDTRASSLELNIERTTITVDSGTFGGTDAPDMLVGRAGTTPVNVFASVKAGNTNQASGDQFTFRHEGGILGLTIASISIDLQAGTDVNAVFNTAGARAAGPTLGSLAGLDASDVTFSPASGEPDSATMTIDFAPGAFAEGDEINFGIDVDRLGRNTGDEFADRGVAFTVTFDDGSSVTQVYAADGGGSAATATLEVPTVGVAIDGQGGDDILMGTDADDTLSGGDGDDRLYGNDGNDRLDGGDGLDILVGGAGDDLLIGGAGADTFAWRTEDIGGTVDNDEIQDFNLPQGDVLDLADLLTGVADGDLADYLHFESSADGAVVNISSTGGFATGFQPGAVDQTILLRDVSLADLGGQTDQDIIDSLLASNGLLTDG